MNCIVGRVVDKDRPSHPDLTTQLCIPCRRAALGWRRLDVDAMSSRCIGVGAALFRCCVPAGCMSPGCMSPCKYVLLVYIFSI